MSEDEELNAICDERKDGPFVVVDIDSLTDPIRTHHIGTIAFQGTEAEIRNMIAKTFGKDVKPY